MAVELADAYISLVPSAKGIQAAIARELGSPLDEVAKRSGQKTSKSFWDEWGAQTQVGGAVVAAGVGLLFKSAVGGASDAAEAASKVGVVFGESADEVKAFAAEAPKAIGASTAEALEMTGTLGNLLVSAGLAGDAAADMSLDMVQLAGDLGSFNNVPTAEALDAIRSGLVGETEPLKRFGVNLNETTLKAEALALGLSDGKTVLDANAKAQAAYSLILKQTGTAQGDFARTSDGVANKQKILAAEFADQRAELGARLIPAWQGLLGVGSEALDLFGMVPSSVQAGTVAFAGMGGAALFLTPKVIEGGRAVKLLGTSGLDAVKGMRGLSTANLSAASTATKLGAAVGVAGAGLAAFSATTAGLNAIVGMLDKDLGNMTDDLALFTETGIATGKVGDSLDDLAGDIKNMQRSGFSKLLTGLGAGVRASEKDIDSLDKSLAELVATGRRAEALDIVKGIRENLTAEGLDAGKVMPKFFDDYYAAIQTANVQAVADAKATTTAVFDLRAAYGTPGGTAAIDVLDEALGKAEQKLTRAQTAIREIIIGPDPIRSEIAAQQAIDAVAQVIEDNGTASLSGIATEDQQENRIAFLDARDAIVDYGIALTDAGVAPDEVQRKVNELSDQLGVQAQEVGVTKDAWSAMRGELGLMPDRVDLAFSTPGLEKAIGDIERLNWKLIEVNVLASGEQRTGGGYGFNYSDRLPATTQGVNNVSESLGFGNRSRRGTTIINYNGVGIEKADRVAGRMIGRR